MPTYAAIQQRSTAPTNAIFAPAIAAAAFTSATYAGAVAIAISHSAITNAAFIPTCAASRYAAVPTTSATAPTFTYCTHEPICLAADLPLSLYCQPVHGCCWYA